MANDVTLTGTFTNTGASATGTLTMTAPLPAGMEYVAGSASGNGVLDQPRGGTDSVLWTFPSLAAGASVNYSFQLSLADATDPFVERSISIPITVTDDSDPAITASASATVTTLPAVPDVDLSCSTMVVTGDQFFTSGEQPDTQTAVRNCGTQDSGPITITWYWPGVDETDLVRPNPFVPGINNGGVYDPAIHGVQWTFANVPAGGAIANTFSGRFIVNAGAASGTEYHSRVVIEVDSHPGRLDQEFNETHTAP